MESGNSGPDLPDLNRLAAQGASAAKDTCPSHRDWRDVAARVLEPEKEEALLKHAAGCDACADRLHEAFSAMDDDPLTAEEQAIVSQLTTSTSEGRQALLQRLVPERLVPAPRRKPVWQWAVAASILLLIGLLPWLYPRWQEWRTGALIAAEYRKARPMPYRVDGVPYGPVRIERGMGALPAVEVPDPARSPSLAALAALLRRDSAAAVSILEQARQSGDASPAVLDNLAVAYAMEADRTGREDAYRKALDLCDEIIRRNPGYAPAFLNRALILERLRLPEASRAAAQQYLRLETDPRWRAEAERLVQP